MSTERTVAAQAGKAPGRRFANIVDAYMASQRFPSHVHPALEALSLSKRQYWTDGIDRTGLATDSLATRDALPLAVPLATGELDKSMYIQRCMYS
jgi:hypothetical protein